MAREDISENCKLSSGYRIRQLLNILQIKLSCIISFYITIIEIRNANQSFSALMKTIRALFCRDFYSRTSLSVPLASVASSNAAATAINTFRSKNAPL